MDINQYRQYLAKLSNKNKSVIKEQAKETQVLTENVTLDDLINTASRRRKSKLLSKDEFKTAQNIIRSTFKKYFPSVDTKKFKIDQVEGTKTVGWYNPSILRCILDFDAGKIGYLVSITRDYEKDSDWELVFSREDDTGSDELAFIYTKNLDAIFKKVVELHKKYVTKK